MGQGRSTGRLCFEFANASQFWLELKSHRQISRARVKALQSQSREALDKALKDAQRLKTLQSFLAKRKLQSLHQQERHDDKALEDVLQARHNSK
jgi:hypothetical protein